MPRVRWSETLEQDEGSASSTSVTKDTQQRKSSLKPSSHSMKKSKAAVREERQRREQAKKNDEGELEAWRERGRLFRANLIMKDEESGGDAFALSHDCEIEKYYDVAERVLEQFLSTVVDDRAKLADAYLVGNRLVKFVSRVLPTHKDYFSNDELLMELRCQSQSQLVQLLQYLEEVALIIDEGEYQALVQEHQDSGEEKHSEEASDEVSDDVSSYDINPYEEVEGPTFEAGALFDLDLQAPQESRLLLIQAHESKSSDFCHQIAPQIQQEGTFSSPRIPEIPPTHAERSARFDSEWSSSFPNDFQVQDWAAELSRVEFEDNPEWLSPRKQQGPSSDREDFILADPDADSFASPEQTAEKVVLKPKAFGSTASPIFIERDRSPKSVLELPEWNVYREDSATRSLHVKEDSDLPFTRLGSGEAYLEPLDVAERPPPSDDGIAEGDEEVASLTGSFDGNLRPVVRHRQSLRHFKGCVRCLLE